MEVGIRLSREDIRIKDLLYKRYGGNAEKVLSMPFVEGYELIEYAVDAEREDRLFIRWATMYQDRMGFEEFQEALTNGEKEEDDQTEEEILKKVKGIIG